MSKLKKIILAGMLLATLVVLARFLSIKTPLIRISFGFIPLMLSATWLGPKCSTLIGGLGDLIGAILFPSGAFFPGYTLSAVLSGLIYGIFLYKNTEDKYTNKQFLFRLIISVAIVTLFVFGILNSIWIYMTSKAAVAVIVPTRIIKQFIMLPIQITTIYFLELHLRKPFYKYARGNDD